jgi:hypothetical protein
MEVHGVESIEPTTICLNGNMVAIPCEDESHLAHLSESASEMSDSTTICEIECYYFQEMRGTPIDLREVVDVGV